MLRVIKFVFIFLLLNNVASLKDEFTPIIDMGEAFVVVPVETTSAQSVSDDFFLSSPMLPSLPMAELLTPPTTFTWSTSYRHGRNFFNGYLLCFYNSYKKLRYFKEHSLSQFEKLFPSVSVHRILPACRYYVFTLRHIII